MTTGGSRKMKSSGSFSDPEYARTEIESVPLVPPSPSTSKRPFITKETDDASLHYFATPIVEARADFQSPAADTELSILSSISTPKFASDPANHDKIYYDDRYNNSFFDPFLALAALPKIAVSIGGMLLTGSILNIIISWDVFKQVSELFILIPVLLNLRSILEQSLIGRISSATSFGVMESFTGRRKIWMGNLNLFMFQSITAGSFAGLMAAFLAYIFDESGILLWRAVLMVIVSAATTATASITSGFFLFILLQLLGKRNSQFVALISPIAAAVGGVSALLLLALNAEFFYLWTGSWIGIACIIMMLFGLNFVFYSRARKNEAVAALATEGWPTMLFSLLVTGLSGLLLQKFINQYNSLFVLFLPTFTGVSGNAAGIYCSEFLAHLHLFQLNSLLPRKTAFTLLILSNPVQLTLIALVSFFNAGTVSLNFPFFVTYLIFSNICVLILMALAYSLIKFFWHLRVKPDSHIGPLMSTLGDFLGTLVLVSAFHFLHATMSLPETAQHLPNSASLPISTNPVEIIDQVVQAAAKESSVTRTALDEMASVVNAAIETVNRNDFIVT